MAVKFKCADCDHVFHGKTAYYEDGHNKRFLSCPKCKTHYTEMPKKIDFVQILMAIFLVIPAFFILFKSMIPFNFGGVGFFCVVMILYMTYIGKQARKVQLLHSKKNIEPVVKN
ncbi:MAG: hypothetical protein ACRBCS_11890 [Cellvibrionaceae bacterium]